MEKIKESRFYPYLKTYELDHSDKEHFLKLKIDDETANELINYLQLNNKAVTIRECYDSQSGWQGFHFIIDNNDLSLNGYCFSSKRLNNYLNK